MQTIVCIRDFHPRRQGVELLPTLATNYGKAELRLIVARRHTVRLSFFV